MVSGNFYSEPCVCSIRYTKSTYLLIEAKRLAKELEERKKKGDLLLRPQSAKTVNLTNNIGK